MNDSVRAWDVSTMVTPIGPVIAERAVYGWNAERTFWPWGHVSAGVASP